jgi:hypothetical protein
VGLTEHHAVEAAGHTKEMPHDRLVNMRVEVACQVAGVDTAALGEKPQHLLATWRRRVLFAGGVELHPVAGGEEHDLATGEGITKTTDRLDRLIAGEGQPLAKGQRNAAVGGAKQGKRHGLSS